MIRDTATTGAIHDYLERTARAEAPLLARLRRETIEVTGDRSIMQISALQGHFMGLLARLMGARRYLELGTFTGYSSMVMAEAVGPEGRVVCCDVSEEFTAMARRYWAEAGYADRVELRLGPALETLAELRRAGEPPFDVAFIDADKPPYIDYYDACVDMVRPGGLVLVDNTLRAGKVADPSNTEEVTLIMRRLAEHAAKDPRVESAHIPIGDGLLMARKRD